MKQEKPLTQISMLNADADNNLDAMMDQIIDDNLEALRALAAYVLDDDPTYHSYHRVIDDVR